MEQESIHTTPAAPPLAPPPSRFQPAAPVSPSPGSLAAHDNSTLPTPPLRSSQSFRLDEGYSGEETPSVYEDREGSDQRSMRQEVKIPAWMTGLNDALREEYAYKLVRSLPTSRIASIVERLVPVLHLDFIERLPSELSLQILSYLPPKSLLDASLASRTWRRFALEPRLWRDLYKAQGWEANENEVRKFEQEMRDRAEAELRQQMDPKRKAEEQKDVGSAEVSNVPASPKNDAVSTMSPPPPMAVETTERQQGVQPGDASAGSSNPMDLSTTASQDTTERGRAVQSFSTATDDEEMYPSPHRTSVSQTYVEPPLPIEPTLTTPGYGTPRLNWAFLFKNRRRLEDNWLRNRYTMFQIPHPNYPHEGHSECIYTIQYSPNWLVSGSRDKTIRVWNLRTRRLRNEPLRGHNGSVLCLQFDESPDEDVIISGSSDSNVIVRRFSTGEIIKVIERAHEESVLNLRFSKKWLVTCSKDKLIKVWNRKHLDTQDPDYPWNSKTIFGRAGAPLNHPHHPNYQPSWSIQDPAASSGIGLRNPFANMYGSPAMSMKSIKSIAPYSAVQALEGHVAAVNAIQLNGNEIASASGDRVIKLWNLKSAICEKTFVGHMKGIACIQFDGKTIVSGSSDQTIRVFDSNTQAELATLHGHSALVRTVQATANKIVSGSYDETVRVWRRDEDTGDWIPGPILRQSQSPTASAPTPRNNALVAPSHAQLQMQALQQFQANQNAAVGTVHMHQVQQAGGPTLAGAVVAAQLLPNNNHHHHHHQQVPQPQPQPLTQSAPAQPQNPGQAAPPQPQAPAQPQQQPPTHANTHTNGNHRVFKLQFDARWILCCSQDTKICGWDYAADEEDVIEASRFFLGGR